MNEVSVSADVSLQVTEEREHTQVYLDGELNCIEIY